MGGGWTQFEKSLRKLEENLVGLFPPPGDRQDDLPDGSSGIGVHDSLAAPDPCPASSGSHRQPDSSRLGHLAIEVLDVDRSLPGAPTHG